MADLAQSLLLLIILLSLMMIIAGDAEMGGSTNHSYFEDCPVTSCEKHGQQIRFPFRNKDHQLPKCGYPGFDVSCKGKQMVLQLPLSGDFFVEGIDYGSQIVRLADPNGCNPRRLLNLKLSSLSPLQILYGYERDYGGLIIYVDNVTYVNCSTSISSTDISYNHFDPIPCLSGWGRYFYSTRSSYRGDVLPRTCDTVKTNMLSLPYYYSYIPFIPNISSSIFMKWESPDCRNCEISGEGCRLDTTTNGTTACFPFPPPPHRKGRKSRAWMKVVIGSSAVFGTVLLSGFTMETLEFKNISFTECHVGGQGKFFIETGTCKFGATCKYHHSQDKHEGYMVRNGVTDTLFDCIALVPFAHQMGLISYDLFQASSLPYLQNALHWTCI